MKFFIAIVVLVSLFWQGQGASLPSTFKICHRSEANLNACFKEAVQVALPLLKDGIPELGIARAEPLEVDSMTIDGTNSQAVNVKQKYTDLKIRGITKSKVDDADLTVGDKEFSANVYITIPECKADADYDFDGKILMLPLSGNGKCHVVLKDVKAVITMAGETYEKKGRIYAKINDLTVKLIPGGATFQFDNLFNGDKALGDRMNSMINENWRSLFSEVSGGYEDLLSDIIKNVANAVFNKIPYEELLPA